MTTRLQDIFVSEISLVDRAANRRRFHLFKAQEPDNGGGTVTQEELITALKALDDDARNDVLKSLGQGEPDKDGIVAAVKKMDKEALGDLYTTLKVIEANPGGPIEAFKVAMEKASDDEKATMLADLGLKLDEKKADDERISKMDPKDRELIEKAQAAADAARKEAAENKERLAKMQTAARRERFIKSVSQFDTLPNVVADDFGPILMKIADSLDEAEYTKLEQVLKGSAALVEDSMVFQEIGSNRGGADTGSAYGEIQVAAQELRKNDPTLTEAQAFTKVYKSRPDLRRKYNTEEQQRKERRGAGDVHGIE